MERGGQIGAVCIMKKEFSTHWVASTLPRKQRKYNYNAPLHIRHKFLSANLSKELRKKYNKRNLPLRKGDEVLVMRGSFKKKKAKVSALSLRRGFAYLEGLQRTKKDGAKINVPFHPSVLQIQALNLEDKMRLSTEPSQKTESAKAVKTEKDNSPKKEKSEKK